METIVANNHTLTESEAASILGISEATKWEAAKRAFNEKSAIILANYPQPLNPGEPILREKELRLYKEALKVLFPKEAAKVINGRSDTKTRPPKSKNLNFEEPKNKQNNPPFPRKSKIDTKKLIINLGVLSAAVFGLMSFLVSAFLECKLLNLVFTNELGFELPFVGISTATIMVLSFEGLKIIAIAFSRWWEVSKINVPSSVVGVTHAFKLLLILLSLLCSLSLIRYAMVEAQEVRFAEQFETEIRAKKDMLYENFKKEKERIEAHYDEILQAIRKKIIIEGKRGFCDDICKKHKEEYVIEEKKRGAAIATLEKSFKEKSAPHKLEQAVREKKKNDPNFSPTDTSMRAFQDVIGLFSNSLGESYELSVYFLGFLLSILLEISIYFSFNAIFFEVFRLKE